MARTEQNVVENEQKAEAMEQNRAEVRKQDERTTTVVSAAEAAFERGLDGNDTEETAEKKSKAELPALYIYRRPYTNKSDGKKYWEYVLPAVFCGQVAEVGLKVRGDKDVAGYQMLETILRGKKKMEVLTILLIVLFCIDIAISAVNGVLDGKHETAVF